jgi:ABC-type sugar transport system substrate-binding protein
VNQRLIAVLTAVAALCLFPVAAAADAPAESDSYEVICVSQRLPGGRSLPTVCVPYPL